MVQKIALTGNEAVAVGMKQMNPDVVAAYPITPQTDIVQFFSQYVSNGEVDTEFITVESEHSAMSATIGAVAAGARSMTATSSQGLALMWEMLYIASSYRLPIVMPVVNRALSGPINIHCDHSDSMGARDSGWIQLYSENAQEAYDNLVQAVRIGEHPDIRLPVMVCQDGFITSHGLENLEILDDEVVRGFIRDFKPENPLLDVNKPVTIGALALPDSYMEFKVQQAEAMSKAAAVVEEVAEEYAGISGRKYGLFETYKLDDAEVAVMLLNSSAGTARVVVDELREKGVKAGMIKPRLFRPFPARQLSEALAGLKAVAVLDRAEGFAATGGPLFNDTKAALYDYDVKVSMVNYVYGLGGRDFLPRHAQEVFDDLARIAEGQAPSALVKYLGVQGGGV